MGVVVRGGPHRGRGRRGHPVDALDVALLAVGDARARQAPARLLAVVSDGDRDQAQHARASIAGLGGHRSQRRRRAGRAGAYSARTGLTTAPSPSISTSTTSPALRKLLRLAPTPDGVPVAMMSPGTSVIVRDSQATVSA